MLNEEDFEQIQDRLWTDFQYVLRFTDTENNVPIFLAWNEDQDEFHAVSVYMGSEIGGRMRIAHDISRKEFFDNLDINAALQARILLIEKIINGEAEMVGDIDPKRIN